MSTLTSPRSTLDEGVLRAALARSHPEVPLPAHLSERARPAAVLVAIALQDAPRTFAMLRAATLRDHAGEVAFPGGKHEAGDADLLATALRESAEEVGLGARDVDIVGALGVMPVITGRYLIHPFVGVLRGGAVPEARSSEIQELISLPILPWIEGERPIRGYRTSWLGEPLVAPHFELGRHVLYGASAYIFYELLERIALTQGRALPPIVIGEGNPMRR